MQEEWKQSVSERRYWDERKDRKLCLGCKTNKLLNFKKKKNNYFIQTLCTDDNMMYRFY